MSRNQITWVFVFIVAYCSHHCNYELKSGLNSSLTSLSTASQGYIFASFVINTKTNWFVVILTDNFLHVIIDTKFTCR